MTKNNKPIIIDDVDVSGCEAIDVHSGWCSFWEEICAKNPNCINKKYLRKEQECDKLYIQLKADEEYHKEEENTLRGVE